MKKISFILSVLALTLSGAQAFAVTPTTTPTPTKSAKTTPDPKATQADKQIEKIKDLVASKVAELKLVEKKGMVGTVKAKSNTEITLVDTKNQEVQVDIDELTKFDGGTDKTFGISDIEKGDVISCIGLYNKDSKKLLARFVSKADNIPVVVVGAVLDKDPEEFTLTLVESNGDKKTIDIATSTKTTSYEDGESAKSGFSKIEVGSRLVVAGFMDTKIDNQLNASRIVYFVSLPASSDMKKHLSQPTEEPTPTPTKTKQ